MSSNLKYGTGRTKFIGQSIVYPIPIPLDAKQHFGAVVCASDGQLYYSDGELWVIPVDTSDISRPQAIEPTNADEATRLTLTTFRSSRGYEQTGILFHISTSGGASFNDFITRIVNSPVDNFYQILNPEDGFSAGDEIWWRAKYLGTNNTQSAFSLPYKQFFPNLIETPKPVTSELKIVGTVEITPFDVAYDYTYVETQFEFYNETGDTLLKTVTINSLPNNVLNVPNDLANKAIYQFRARYGARATFGAPTEYSEWSEKRKFINGTKSIILEYDVSKMIDNTIGVPLGSSNVNVTINWGDGNTETFTTNGVKRHTYAPETTGIITVSISGTLGQYGNSSVTRNDQIALIRVNSFGYQMGLTSLQYAFANTTINLSYITPDIPPEITDMSWAFYRSATIADLRNLNLTNVTTTARMFSELIGSGPLIDGWDLPNVTNMSYMFFSASTFNRPIGNWKLYNVTNMSYMFYSARAFNQPISNWDVSKVTNMSSMFYIAENFNQPIGNWNTSNVTNMSYMFYFASKFNQSIGNWGVSNVINMTYMFHSAYVFNQSLNNWDVSNVTNMSSMFYNAEAFNQPLDNWNVSNVTNMSNMFRGSIFNRPIGNWNVSNVTNMSYMFAFNYIFNQPIGNWDVSNVTNMNNMFRYATAFNQDINSWDTSNVTDMSFMFASANVFNKPLFGWNTSKVVDMSWMFSNTLNFNQPIGNWDTSNVINMSYMFNFAQSFNQPIGDWDVSNVTNMSYMFATAYLFDQDLSRWAIRKNVQLTNIITNTSMSTVNYSRLLAGWANTIAQNDGPNNINFTLSNRQYTNVVVFPGERFQTGAEGRNFLTTARSYQIANAANATANGIYTYSADLLVYVNESTGWFLESNSSGFSQDQWILKNEVGDIMSIGTGSSPMAISNWTNALENAVVIKYGAGWTITGDSLV